MFKRIETTLASINLGPKPAVALGGYAVVASVLAGYMGLQVTQATARYRGAEDARHRVEVELAQVLEKHATDQEGAKTASARTLEELNAARAQLRAQQANARSLEAQLRLARTQVQSRDAAVAAARAALDNGGQKAAAAKGGPITVRPGDKVIPNG